MYWLELSKMKSCIQVENLQSGEEVVRVRAVKRRKQKVGIFLDGFLSYCDASFTPIESVDGHFC